MNFYIIFRTLPELLKRGRVIKRVAGADGVVVKRGRKPRKNLPPPVVESIATEDRSEISRRPRRTVTEQTESPASEKRPRRTAATAESERGDPIEKRPRRSAASTEVETSVESQPEKRSRRTIASSGAATVDQAVENAVEPPRGRKRRKTDGDSPLLKPSKLKLDSNPSGAVAASDVQQKQVSPLKIIVITS